MPNLRVSPNWIWPGGLLFLAYLLPQETARGWAAKWSLLAGALALVAVWAVDVAAWKSKPQAALGRCGHAGPIPALVWIAPCAWMGLTTLWALDPVRSMEQSLVIAWTMIILASGSFGTSAALFVWPVLVIAGADLLVGSGQYGRGISRPHGIFVNANHHAALMAAAYAILTAQAARLKPVRAIPRHLAGSLFLGAAALSATRSILIAAPAVLAAIYIQAPRRINRGSMLLALVLAAGILASPLGPGRRIVETALGGDPFSLKRVDIWSAAGRIIRESPLLGTGMGGFGDAFPAARSADLAKYRAEYAHNEIIQFAAEAGLLGAGLAAWFLACLGRIWRARRRPEPDGADALACAAALAAFCLFGFPMHVPVLAIAMVGALWAALPLRHAGTALGRGPGLARAAVWGAILLPAAWMVLGGMAELQYIEGAESSRRGEVARARRSLERAVSLNPLHAGALHGMAELSRDRSEASRLFLKAHALRRAWIPPVAGLFGNALLSGDLGEAGRMLALAESLDPFGLDTRLMGARYRAAEGEHKAASAIFAKLEEMWPGNLEIWLARAEVAAMAQDKERAREIAARVLSLYPGNMAAMDLLRRLD